MRNKRPRIARRNRIERRGVQQRIRQDRIDVMRAGGEHIHRRRVREDTGVDVDIGGRRRIGRTIRAVLFHAWHCRIGHRGVHFRSALRSARHSVIRHGARNERRLRHRQQQHGQQRMRQPAKLTTMGNGRHAAKTSTQPHMGAKKP